MRRRGPGPCPPPRERNAKRERGGVELILAIETSCDDTCAAVLEGPRIRSNLISSQADAHAAFGGVVPRSPPATTSS